MIPQHQISVSIPLLSQEQFSILTGLPTEVVRGWISKGHIPTVKIGRRRLVNMARLTQEMIEMEK